MTTMLEKAARAMALERGWDEGYDDPHFRDQYHRDNGPSAYTSEARAVLLAIREPDEGMQNVGVDAATGTFEGWVDEGQVSTLFTAMIDTILAEETGT